jgi:hypothetical protein
MVKAAWYEMGNLFRFKTQKSLSILKTAEIFIDFKD